MKLEEIRNISVLGAGIMGHGIAQSFLMGGYTVMLYDIQESILETAKAHIEKNLGLFSRFNLIEKQDIELSLQRLSTTVELSYGSSARSFNPKARPFREG
jgi:3-hydroxybutyryl-CoA dehydrogenase